MDLIYGMNRHRILEMLQKGKAWFQVSCPVRRQVLLYLKSIVLHVVLSLLQLVLCAFLWPFKVALYFLMVQDMFFILLTVLYNDAEESANFLLAVLHKWLLSVNMFDKTVCYINILYDFLAFKGSLYQNLSLCYIRTLTVSSLLKVLPDSEQNKIVLLNIYLYLHNNKKKHKLVLLLFFSALV